jgi:hypothetical protein
MLGMLCRRDSLRHSICALYSLDIALNIDVNISFNNTQEWKETPYVYQKAKEINGGETYTVNDETFL